MTQQLLMIEDDTRLATMVGEYLRQSGYGFSHAATGASGLEALQASLGLPLPAATQWDIVHELAERIEPVYHELIRQAAQGAQFDERQLRRIEGIINSMTLLERAKPDLLKASRKRRIATGAGVSVQEVNRLLNQFEQMQKMMKMMQKGGMAKMMRSMKGLIPRAF